MRQLVWGLGLPGPGGSAAHEPHHYRCSLPDLAGFAAARCTEPET
jgi:hypothetical protein